MSKKEELREERLERIRQRIMAAIHVVNEEVIAGKPRHIKLSKLYSELALLDILQIAPENSNNNNKKSKNARTKSECRKSGNR